MTATPVVVLDGGSRETRVAVAGDEEPALSRLASVVGRSADGPPSHDFYGDEALKRDFLELRWPLASPAPDWDAAERLWARALTAAAAATTHLVVALPGTAPATTRARYARAGRAVADRVALVDAAVLAVVGYGGSPTGCCVDVGASSARVTPVVEGHAVPHAVVASERLGGDALDGVVLGHLRRVAGAPFASPDGALAAAARVKREAAVVGTCRATPPPARVALDGRWVAGGELVLELSGEERLWMGEQLFESDDEVRGLQDLVAAAAAKAGDADAFWANVTLCGGGSLLAGLPERLASELASIAETATVTWDGDRADAAAVGGAVLAAFLDFDDGDRPLRLTAEVRAAAASRRKRPPRRRRSSFREPARVSDDDDAKSRASAILLEQVAQYRAEQGALVEQLRARERALEDRVRALEADLAASRKRYDGAAARYEAQNADLTKRIALHATRAWKEQALLSESSQKFDEAATVLQEESDAFVEATKSSDEFTPVQCLLAGAVLGVAAFAFGLAFAPAAGKKYD